MKILLATSAAIPAGGGIASYNQELVRALGYDYEIHLLTASREFNVPGYASTLSLQGKNVLSFKFALSLVKYINEQKYNLILNSNSSVMAYLAPFVNAPIVTVSHFVNGIHADCAGYNNEYISRIIALSNYGKQYIEKKFCIKEKDKVVVVYNFVHPIKFSLNKLKQNPLVIVYPGGTSIMKSADVVMETAYRLKKSDLNFRFVWLGGTRLPSDNMSIFGIREITQMLHGDERFEIVGRVPREIAESYIAQSNIFLLPSRGEGCPMTLLEAMRVGCIPVVSDAHHGSREIIEMCKCGEIVQQGNSKALYNTIKNIIINYNDYIDCYKQTSEFSSKFLSPEIWTEQMADVIKNAIYSTKKTIELKEEEFNESLKGYLKFQRIDRHKMQIASAINRIKMDWLYIKWKGWK